MLKTRVVFGLILGIFYLLGGIFWIFVPPHIIGPTADFLIGLWLVFNSGMELQKTYEIYQGDSY